MDQQKRIAELEAELERWRSLHGADDPGDAIRQDARGKEAALLDERLKRIRDLERELAKQCNPWIGERR